MTACIDAVLSDLGGITNLDLRIDRNGYIFIETDDEGSHNVGSSVLVENGDIFELHAICHLHIEVH